jgi:hypothetical protein
MRFLEILCARGGNNISSPHVCTDRNGEKIKRALKASGIDMWISPSGEKIKRAKMGYVTSGYISYGIEFNAVTPSETWQDITNCLFCDTKAYLSCPEDL